MSIQKIELIYDKSKQINEVIDFLLKSKNMHQKYLEIREEQKSPDTKGIINADLESEEIDIIETFNDKLYKLILRYKHQAYEREEEVRLVVSENEVEQDTTRFKISESGVFIEYFPLKLHLRNNVKSVTVHPLNGQLHAQGIKAFIKSVTGYNTKIEIKDSKIPFRIV